MSIPVVDLYDFTTGDAGTKSLFVNALGHAFESTGFVAVSHHGIPDEMVAGLYVAASAFFALPESAKKQYERPELSGQRGYTCFGTEHAKGFDAPDLKEFFQFGQPVTPANATQVDYPDNVEVGIVPGFTAKMLEAYTVFEQCGMQLLRAIALYLQLDEHYFDEWVLGGNSILRAIYYPPIRQEPASAIRAEQHEDINLITLLVGSSAQGLEILSRQGAWVPVTSLPGQIVVNVGDMLQRLTNNCLRSTTHRVVNPPREQWHTARYSIPFFLHPRSEMSLACLESCTSMANPKSYADCNAGEYLDERLREIGLKK